MKLLTAMLIEILNEEKDPAQPIEASGPGEWQDQIQTVQTYK